MKCHALGVLVLAASCQNEPAHSVDPLDTSAFPQYSSKVTVESGGRKNVYEYYRDGAKRLIVPALPEGATSDQRVVIIVDEEAGTATAVSMGRKQYYVRPLGARGAASAPSITAGSWRAAEVESREDLGSETVGEHPCAMQRVSMKAADGTYQIMKVWQASDLGGFPLKIEMNSAAGPVTTTFTDVKLGARPDPALLVVPPDFKDAAGSGRRRMTW